MSTMAKMGDALLLLIAPGAGNAQTVTLAVPSHRTTIGGSVSCVYPFPGYSRYVRNAAMRRASRASFSSAYLARSADAAGVAVSVHAVPFVLVLQVLASS